MSLDAVRQPLDQTVVANSPSTYNDFNGTANAAVEISQALDLAPERILFVRHVGLLHDLDFSVSEGTGTERGRLRSIVRGSASASKDDKGQGYVRRGTRILITNPNS